MSFLCQLKELNKRYLCIFKSGERQHLIAFEGHIVRGKNKCEDNYNATCQITGY